MKNNIRLQYNINILDILEEYRCNCIKINRCSSIIKYDLLDPY